ncbi:hypothetical protein C7H19_16735 [Aphanothece hegewaldii CCALA 016]|uniref:Uncharacterized protein n=1 Tax=Aphanothece hegewaldii CCALA 016 TaxID=2107694 RepID=A0A2T1LUX0_9CHRO|nr:hypothetical protein [Aphanothece hegewaldii]PSF35426.1 hypothetical protein C7H19_16735 [Aphanothece hegewaldii CCALA 016]
MAQLPPEKLILITNLFPRLFEVINLATETEYNLFEQYGETTATIYELDQIKNAAEWAKSFYNRLYILTLQVAESQPVASSATLNLLLQSIEQAQATADAVEATAQETKRTWGI